MTILHRADTPMTITRLQRDIKRTLFTAKSLDIKVIPRLNIYNLLLTTSLLDLYEQTFYNKVESYELVAPCFLVVWLACLLWQNFAAIYNQICGDISL